VNTIRGVTTGSETRPGTVKLPAWIGERVERFHEARFARDWGGQHVLHGRTPVPGDILLNSNDYLALGADPRITDAMTGTLSRTGAGMLASGALMHGDHPQLRLERALAEHMNAGAGVLCQSGWDANAGLIQAIATEATPVYVDMLAHMSLWYGARVANAPVVPFRHNDVARLRLAIERRGAGIIAVDTLYSSNGSLCPLGEICALAEETGCVVVADESHSLGTYGTRGEGIVCQQGLEGSVLFRVASLSKAFAGRAGFIACPDERFVAYFKMESLPAVFSSTLLPHDVAGLAAALDVIRAEGWRRERLHRAAAYLRSEIAALGFDLDGSDSQIISLPAGSEMRAIAVRDALEIRSVFGSVFCPPATTRNRAVVRFSVHAALTDDQVEQVIRTCREIRDELGTTARPVPRQRRGNEL
jgi:CAI-1 autoinducer synthase